MLLQIVLLVTGIYFLIQGADLLVEASVSLAKKNGISMVIVGAVIVGFGTSLPEMAVSTMAAGTNDLDLGVGNVIGSVVANLSLVLGGAALAGKVPISQRSIKTYLPLSLNAVFWFCFFVQGGLRRYEGFILLSILIISLSLIVRIEKEDSVFPSEEDPDELTGRRVKLGKTLQKIENKDIGKAVIGFSLIVISSWVITESSTGLADEWGIGSGFVGASLVAVGTSLPELAASIVAVRKGKPEIIIGAILGSNIFNGAAIGATMGIIGPGEVSDDSLIGAVTIVSISVIVLFWIGKGVSKEPVGKISGLILLLIYGLWMLLVGV